MNCVSLVLIAAMARPIKLFQFVRKLYHLTGIYPPQSGGNYKFNLKNGFFIFAWVQMTTFTGAFFLFKAERFSEFSISFHMCTALMSDLFCFIMNIYQIENMLKLIEKFNEFMQKSWYMLSLDRIIQLKKFEFILIFIPISNRIARIGFVHSVPCSGWENRENFETIKHDFGENHCPGFPFPFSNCQHG